MKIAMIADMHGDSLALNEALVDIKSEGCDKIYCLGDMVDSKTAGTGVLDIIRDSNIPTVFGNHDFDLFDGYNDDIKHYLNELPKSFSIGDAYLTHISPLNDEKIRNGDDALGVFMETEHKIVFVAHNHFPYVFGYNGDVIEYDLPFIEPLVLDDIERYIICIGALGDRREPPVPRQYTIFDTEQSTVKFKQY